MALSNSQRLEPKLHLPKFAKPVGFRQIRQRHRTVEKQQKPFLNWAEAFGRETSSSIHGLRRLCDNQLNRKERWVSKGDDCNPSLQWLRNFSAFWCVVLLVILLSLLYVCVLIANRYRNAQLETVIETTTFPVYKIAFPEVTFCNNNRLNWSRLPQAKKQFLVASHRNTSLENAFDDIVSRYDNLVYGRFDLFNRLPPREILETLNYVNFSSVVRFMAWRCEELVESCHWQHRPVNCCDIIFPRISQMGSCLAFNSIESRQGILKQMKDSKWPWRPGKYGPGSGLRMRLRLAEKDHLQSSRQAKGIRFMVAETYVWYSTPAWVPTFSQVIVSIHATINVRDEETMAVPASQRGCVFENEKGDHHFKKLNGYEAYMFQNCESECQQETLVRYCNCTVDLFFPRSSYRVCQLVDLPCLAKYNYRMQQFDRSGEAAYTVSSNSTGIPCTCLLKCKLSLRFSPQTHINAMEASEAYANNSFIDMDLYFRYRYIFVYKTNLVFNWVDLLVAFGGLAGLFVGFSLITLVDVGYFFIKDKLK